MRKNILIQWSCCILTLPNKLLKDQSWQELWPSSCYRMQHRKNKRIGRHFLKTKRRWEYNNPKQFRAKCDQPSQRWETGLSLHALQLFNIFCANSFKSGRSTGPLEFLFLEWQKSNSSRSRTESEVAKTVVVSKIANGIWYGPPICLLSFFKFKLSF